MRRPLRTPVFLLAMALRAALAAPAAADPTPALPPSAPTAATPAPAATVPVAPAAAPESTPAPAGVAVVALPGARAVAWPLARSVYADPVLRPSRVDEVHARVLCGEPAPADGGADVRDLADSVAALHDDDAPTRVLLGDLARRFSLRALVVVRAEAGRASARVFLPDTRSFDAATYAPDDDAALSWASAVRSLDRSFGAQPPATGVATLATHAAPKKEEGNGKAFYESGWFWGAVGAAVVIGGAAFLATRDSGPSTIHLQVRVPH